MNMKIDISTKKHPNTYLLIDKKDFNRLDGWSIYPIKTSKLYVRAVNGEERHYLHRFLKNCPKGLVVDHINGNTLDNRQENLRICTVAQNSQNKKGHHNKKYSKYKGVTVDKNMSENKCYKAQIFVKGKTKNLGIFYTPEEAAEAYNDAAVKYFGEFAYLNLTI